MFLLISTLLLGFLNISSSLRCKYVSYKNGKSALGHCCLYNEVELSDGDKLQKLLDPHFKLFGPEQTIDDLDVGDAETDNSDYNERNTNENEFQQSSGDYPNTSVEETFEFVLDHLPQREDIMRLRRDAMYDIFSRTHYNVPVRCRNGTRISHGNDECLFK